MSSRKKGTAIATLATLLACLGLVVVAPLASAATFTNGSFESASSGFGLPPLNNYYSPAVGGTGTMSPTSIAAWTITSGNVNWLDNGFWQAEDGKRSIDLSGSAPGAIAQAFTTTAGDIYNVSFWMSGNPSGGPSLKTMSVSAAATTMNFTYDTSASGNTSLNMMYKQESLSFAAACDTTTSTLTFTSTTQTNFGPVLDNVSAVLASPQPVNPCAPPPTVPTDVYAAKFLCGTSTLSVKAAGPVVAGTYSTSVNVHNPNGDTVAFRKKAILLYRADKPPTAGTYESPKSPGPFFQVRLEPNWGMEIDCGDIRAVLLKSSGVPTIPTFIEGWVVIEVPGVNEADPAPLNVTDVNTSNAGLDVESIVPTRVTK